MNKKNKLSKIIKIFSIFMLIIGLVLPLITYANNSTTQTYTLSTENEWIRTQDAYLVSGILFQSYDLNKPEDICIRNDKLYIADTGNSRIVIYDRSNGAIKTIGQGILKSPTGVFVNEKEDIYVADYGLEKVFIFDKNGIKINEFKRPESILFGKYNSFKPRKVASDKRGNIYIVSEGSFDGIIQLNRTGEFLGYFGANKVAISFIQVLQDLFFTEQQKSQLFYRIPRPYYNITIDKKGLIYTITQQEKGNSVKKHNTLGNNILYLSKSNEMADEENFVDIDVGRYGQIYTITETGLIYEYDENGSLLFSFGGRAIATERNGLITVASGIAVDENDNVFVLDKERGIVHVYYPTQYANLIHSALSLFLQGKYKESKKLWEEVLRLNSVSKVAHNGLGKAYFQEGNYELAAFHFKIAGNRKEYSEAYWELRNNFLQRNMLVIVLVLICLYLLIKIYKILLFKGVIKRKFVLRERLKKAKVIDDLLYLKNLIKHPIDSFYYIKKGEKTSIISASIIYILFIIVFALDYAFRGFIFSSDIKQKTPSYILILTTLPLTLWVFSNYLVSSINDGEGKLKHIYISTAYSLAPYILFQPFVVLLTYVLTINEQFIINFSSQIFVVWSGIIMFIATKEIHDYNIRNTIKTILLSLFWIVVIVITGSIIYMLWDQVIGFVYSIFKEVIYRVY
ncbi:YIP1 family protein [Caldicellulosiruptoraceae bacterium PP1]